MFIVLCSWTVKGRAHLEDELLKWMLDKCEVSVQVEVVYGLRRMDVM